MIEILNYSHAGVKVKYFTSIIWQMDMTDGSNRLHIVGKLYYWTNDDEYYC